MKKSIIALAVLLISANSFAQHTKLEITPEPIFVPVNKSQAQSIGGMDLLEGKLLCSAIGVPLQSFETKLPFKVYTVQNTNWILNQDIYNSVNGTVPGVQITQNGLDQIPNIRIRGTDNTIVIVDGVRVDASLLNMLNPADVESVKVANNPAAELFLRFR